jgi:hypothetical protein
MTDFRLGPPDGLREAVMGLATTQLRPYVDTVDMQAVSNAARIYAKRAFCAQECLLQSSRERSSGRPDTLKEGCKEILLGKLSRWGSSRETERRKGTIAGNSEWDTAAYAAEKSAIQHAGLQVLTSTCCGPQSPPDYEMMIYEAAERINSWYKVADWPPDMIQIKSSQGNVRSLM